MVRVRDVSKEFEQFVSVCFAMFNRELFEGDRRNVVRAWFDVLGDVDVELLRVKFVELATVSKVMPTPGLLRRHVFADRISDVVSPAVAWGQLQGLRVALNSGVERPVLAVTVVETIQRLGDVVFGLTTNGDREYFLEVYRDVCEKRLVELLRVGV